MKKYIILLFVLGLIVYACEQEPVGQQPIENVPPGPVSDVNVESTYGGAIITFKLPADEDLLYVKAVYSLREGVRSEIRGSLYKNTLKIEGFGDMLEHEVKLIAVDRSRNESPEVVVKVKPLEPPVVSVGKSLRLLEDFGGVHAFWENPQRAEVAVVIIKEDKNKEFNTLETFRNTMVVGEGIVRGQDTISQKFGCYVRDRWGNQSEIKYVTLKPIFETMFNRTKFREVLLPNDKTAHEGDPITKAFDGDYGMYNYYHTVWGDGIWPSSFTMDLGQVVKLSRFKVFQRMQFPFGLGNLKDFEVWGCETLNTTGSWDGWTKLANYKSVKPSGLPEQQYTSEDYEYAAAGENFTVPFTAPKVRYLRFRVTEVWGTGGDAWHICEMEFYGDNR